MGIAPRRLAVAVITTATATLLSACGSGGDATAVKSEYQLTSASGTLDSILVLTAATSSSAYVPAIQYGAVDAKGTLLADVKVHTAFGSDAGTMLVPGSDLVPGVFDLLAFEGPGVDRVADVTTTIDPGPRAPLDGWTNGGRYEPVVLTPLASTGDNAPPMPAPAPRAESLSNGEASLADLAAVGLTNPASFDVQVNLYWVEFGTGSPQLFLQSEEIGAARVPGGGSVSVDLPAGVLSAIEAAESAGHYVRIQAVLGPEQPGLRRDQP